METVVSQVVFNRAPLILELKLKNILQQCSRSKMYLIFRQLLIIPPSVHEKHLSNVQQNSNGLPSLVVVLASVGWV